MFTASLLYTMFAVLMLIVCVWLVLHSLFRFQLCMIDSCILLVLVKNTNVQTIHMFMLICGQNRNKGLWIFIPGHLRSEPQ